MNKTPLVLVVEDNPITRKMVRVALTVEGYRVAEAGDGATATAVVQRETPDIVLLDLLLPDATGFDVLKQLRALPQASGTPILAFTGFLSRDEESRVLDAGFDGLLVKPVAPSQLALALSPYLSKPAHKKAIGDSMGSVLLVDDDPVQVKVVRLYLLHAGFDVTTAFGGEEALATARRQRPDFIVSDVLMPGIDGFQLCTAIRADPMLSSVPVVLMSSKYVDDADRELGRMVGAQEFLQRLPDPRELFAALNRAATVRVSASPEGAWDSLRREYLSRVLAQLERQSAANSGLVQRASVLSASLSVLAAISTSLADRVAAGESDFPVEDILHRCVEAAGISRGAVFLRQGPDTWSCAASVGFGAKRPEALEELVQPDSVLHRITAEYRTLIVPSADMEAHEGQELLVRLAASSVIIAAVPAGDRKIGALLLTSADRDLSGPEWRAFAETVAANLGQALALHSAVSQLSASEVRYRRLFEDSPIAKKIAMPDGRIIDANIAAARMFGFKDRDSLVAAEPRSLWMNAADREALIAIVNQQGYARNHEAVMRRLDGTPVWVLISITIVRNADGTIAQLENDMVDITERRQAEQSLRETEERFSEIAENVREVFFVNDPATGRTLYVNPAWETVFGQSVEYALKTPLAFTEQIHPEDRAAMAAAATSAGAVVDRADYTFRLVKPGGEIRWIHATTTNIRDASGRIARQVGVAEDITEFKRTEAQFQHSQKMEAVGLLAGGIAHDFNNLLTVIKGYGGFLLESIPKADPNYELVEEMVTAGDRAAALTRQLLAFSRKQRLDPRVLDLNAIVTALDKMLRRIVSERIELHTDLGRDVGPVRGDAGQVEQVIVNLVVNARDAMPSAGEIAISTTNVDFRARDVAAQPDLREGAWVRLCVRDTGTGMDAATRARIFEPFFTTKDVGYGTGLGLSTTMGIVGQSGGFITVDTALGQGTAFNIYLPRIEAAPDTLAERMADLTTLRGTETVLLVEDDDSVRAIVARTLKSQGYTLIKARHPSEALVAAQAMSGAPDLILTDLVMPKMSGRELVRHLRERWPSVRVLFMSGYSDEAINAPSGEFVGSGFINKPFRTDQLVAKVREVLDSPVA